jgi:hypothetical protein
MTQLIDNRRVGSMNWKRAYFSGMSGAFLLMMFLDIFNTMGIGHFSLEEYIGTALANDGTFSSPHWVLGFSANLIIGGFFGLLYGFFFEFVFFNANSRLGTLLGLYHAFFAAVAFFPFFQTVHGQLGTGVYPNFGFFGSGIDAVTPILLLMGHFGFGATMGTFYGPVYAVRLHDRAFEPGENLLPGDPDAIRYDEQMAWPAEAGAPRSPEDEAA